MTAAYVAVCAVLIVAHALRPRPRRAPTQETLVEEIDVRIPQWVRRPFARLRASLHRRRLARGHPSPSATARWCDELSRRVRGGSTLVDAITQTIPDDPRLEAATDAIRLRLERGVNLTDALATAGDSAEHRTIGPRRRRDAVHVRLALSVIAAAATHGGSTGQALDHVGAALRLRAADEQERAAHSAQARLSANVLTAVPLGFLVLMVVLDRSVRDVIASPVGIAIVMVGITLDGVGWLWMRSIVGGRR
jgi:Flp pilus assembly protein TadB